MDSEAEIPVSILSARDWQVIELMTALELRPRRISGREASLGFAFPHPVEFHIRRAELEELHASRGGPSSSITTMEPYVSP